MDQNVNMRFEQSSCVCNTCCYSIENNVKEGRTTASERRRRQEVPGSNSGKVRTATDNVEELTTSGA